MTFFVLQITSKLAKKSNKTIRLVLASIIGAVYSLIILFDEMPFAVSLVTKLLSSAIIVLVAFKHYRLKKYFICLMIFFFSSMIMLGIIVAFCFVFKSNAIAINNSSVYFDISAIGLIVAGFVSYILSGIIMRLYNRSLSSREIYTLIIEHNGGRAVLLAMLDTGNKLREPFSNESVIVVEKSKVAHLLAEESYRLVPTTSVSGAAMLQAFKPQRLVIKTSKGSEVIENAYIALSDDSLADDFSAVLNPNVLSV